MKLMTIALVHQRKNLVLTLVKTNLSLSLHYTSDISYFYVNKTDICIFEVHDNICWYVFRLGSVSNNFPKHEQSEISVNCTVYDFLVDYSSMEKEDIFNYS